MTISRQAFPSPFSAPGAYQNGLDQFMVGSSRNPQHAKPQTAQPRKYQDGQASKWVSAFKIAFSLLVAGGINAFIFGVPVWVAAGVSAAVSGAQSILALKIHKEDNEFSRKVISGTRWLMGRNKDYTPSGKEWSMVPVWGVACGLMALVESMLNHGYKKWFSKDGNKPFAEIMENREKDIRKKLKASSSQLQTYIYKAQLEGMELRKRGVDFITKTLKAWEASSGWKKDFGTKLAKFWNQGGKCSMRTAYMLACGAAMFGGIFQTSVAAYMQGKIDRRNGFK